MGSVLGWVTVGSLNWSGRSRHYSNQEALIISPRFWSDQRDLWVQRVQDGAAERLSFNTPFSESQGKVSRTPLDRERDR